MANDNIGGTVIILLKLPNGGISRSKDLPADPDHHKGDTEIVMDIIEKGIESIDWELSSASSHNGGSFSLKYVGE